MSDTEPEYPYLPTGESSPDSPVPAYMDDYVEDERRLHNLELTSKRHHSGILVYKMIHPRKQLYPTMRCVNCGSYMKSKMTGSITMNVASRIAAKKHMSRSNQGSGHCAMQDDEVSRPIVVKCWECQLFSFTMYIDKE